MLAYSVASLLVPHQERHLKNPDQEIPPSKYETQMPKQVRDMTTS